MPPSYPNTSNGLERAKAGEHGSAPSRAWQLDLRRVGLAAFAVISGCILVGVVTCVLAIWDLIGGELAWRVVASCIVVAGGAMAFCSLVGAGPKRKRG